MLTFYFDFCTDLSLSLPLFFFLFLSLYIYTYMYIVIEAGRQQELLLLSFVIHHYWPSFLVGLLDEIQFPHNVGVCIYLLASQYWCVHV